MLRFENFYINSGDNEYNKALYDKVKTDATREPTIRDGEITFVIREKGSSYKFLIDELKKSGVPFF